MQLANLNSSSLLTEAQRQSALHVFTTQKAAKDADRTLKRSFSVLEKSWKMTGLGDAGSIVCVLKLKQRVSLSSFTVK